MARLVLIKLARSRGVSWLGGYPMTENEWYPGIRRVRTLFFNIFYGNILWKYHQL